MSLALTTAGPRPSPAVLDILKAALAELSTRRNCRPLRKSVGRAIPAPALPPLERLEVVDEGVEPIAFGRRAGKPDLTYRLRCVNTRQTAAHWNYRSLAPVGDTMDEIDKVLALRHSQTYEATLVGICAALALDAVFGEDVPAGELA